MGDWIYHSFIGFLLGMAFSTIVAVNVSTPKAHAIERGLALYCPQDGRFAWKGECAQ